MNEEESKSQRIIHTNGESNQIHPNQNASKGALDQQQSIQQKENQIKRTEAHSSDRNTAFNDKIQHYNHVDHQQVFNTEGNQQKQKQERKFSYLGKTNYSEKQKENSQLKQTKNTKGKVEYDIVKDFLVKTYTDQCEEDGQMELIQMPTKRSNIRRKGKKAPIKVQDVYQDAQQKKQLNDVFQYTIVDNKKKRQEIKLKQRLVREISIHTHSTITEESKDNQLILQDHNLSNKFKQKSQSFYLDNNNDNSQTNLNNTHIQTIQEEPDIIVIEDSYPLEWDPGFNKKARKKLDLINQTRSNNTLPILDLSNTKNVERYRHILNSKQGWQPLLNTPFLPISPQNQLKKADLFKNLLKEQKNKFHKSRTPVKSRVKERQNNLQNKWGEYYLQTQTSIEFDPKNILITENKDLEQKEEVNKQQPGEISLNQKPKQQQIQSIHLNTNNNSNNTNKTIKELPSKVIEVEENSLASSMKPGYQFINQTQDFDKDQGNVEEINERIGQLMQMIPQKKEIPKYNQSQKQTPLRDMSQQSRVQTANIKKPGNRRIVRYNSNEYQTVSNFYQAKEEHLLDKQGQQNLYSNNQNVSKSQDFYSKCTLPSNKLIRSREQLNEQFSIKDQQRKLNTLSYSTINYQIEEQNFKAPNSIKHQESKESFYKETLPTKQVSVDEQNKKVYKPIISQDQNNGNHQVNNLQNIQDTIKIQQKRTLKKKINFTNKPFYITYQDQKMFTEGDQIEYENPDLKQTIKVQEMMIQEQKLKQQLSILRSQGDRVSKLENNLYYNDEGCNFQSQRVTPFTKERRKETLTPVLRKNYSSLAPVNNSNQKNQINYQTINNRNMYDIQNEEHLISNQEKVLQSQNIISIENNKKNENNNNDQYQNQSIQTLNNNQSTVSTLAKTNTQQQIIRQNSVNKQQNRTPIPRRTNNQNETKNASKSPINNKKTIIVKDNLSPHQRIYVQQGQMSNQILQNKTNQNATLQQPSYQNDENQYNQTFSQNVNNVQSFNNLEQEISEEQEMQISKLKQQFDSIIQNCQLKPKKNNQQQRRYVQQSFI
ncbi:hypothetical protein ABPG72_017132 [Tetrahymena utriculariae]